MTENIENFDVDATLEAIEQPGTTERPMETPREPEPQVQQSQEYEFQYNGKPIKAPIDKILKWASQGYDYPQRMSEVNKMKMELEQKYSGYDKFSEVDQYARSNPDWWKHVSESYANRSQQLSGNSGHLPEELAPVLNPLQEKLSGIESKINAWETEKMQQQRQKEDEQLEGEIKSIQSEFKDLDLNRVDEEGYTLEYRVLEHANRNGIKSFKTAFMDYMAPELIKRAESRGREAAVKERQEQAKKGLLGRTQAPTKQLTQAQNIKQKSYQDLLNEAKAELGIQ